MKSPSLGAGDLGFVTPNGGRTGGSWIHLEEDRSARVVRIASRLKSDAPDAHPARSIVVALSRDASDGIRLLERLRLVLAVVWLTSTSVLATVLVWSIRSGVAPLRQLGEEIGRLDASRLGPPLDARGDVPDEVRPVVEALNAMLARLAASFSRERALVANVAHELRTPLAGLRTTLEVALMNPGGGHGDFERCLAITGDMQSMVENLLMLARLDAGQTHMRSDVISLDELVRDGWVVWRSRAAERGLSVTWELKPVLVQGDRDLLRIVLRNLYANAIAHCNDGGFARVTLRSTGQWAELEVANSGSLLGPECASAVFERFWRGDAARSGDGAHCGLGLPICREIVTHLAGTIDVRCEVGGEFAVTILLPAHTAVEAAS